MARLPFVRPGCPDREKAGSLPSFHALSLPFPENFPRLLPRGGSGIPIPNSHTPLVSLPPARSEGGLPGAQPLPAASLSPTGGAGQCREEPGDLVFNYGAGTWQGGGSRQGVRCLGTLANEMVPRQPTEAGSVIMAVRAIASSFDQERPPSFFSLFNLTGRKRALVSPNVSFQLGCTLRRPWGPLER